MKTLVVYASTYGYAKKAAESISERLSGQIDIVNILSESPQSITQYDKVIIGGSIYMGQIQKKIKEFCIKNLDELKSKKVGLYICCGLLENFELNLKNAYPAELIEKASAVECFGGELNIAKMKFFHRVITNVMIKASAKEGKVVEPLKQNIEKFISVMNSL